MFHFVSVLCFPCGEVAKSRGAGKILSAVWLWMCPTSNNTPVMRRREGSRGGHNFYYGRNEKAQRQVVGVHTFGERRAGETQVCVGWVEKSGVL